MVDMVSTALGMRKTMPAQYEHIRDSYVAKGMNYDKAQSIAAATYNKHHPKNPMSPAHPEGKLSALKKYLPRKK